MAFHDGRLAFHLANAVSQVGAEFIECFELGFCRKVAVQIANEADADRDVIQVVARDMAPVDLAGPAGADLDLAVAGGGTVADDEMVGEAVLHFTNSAVVIVENPGVSLAGSAVVDDDVFPATLANFGIVDRFAHGGAEVTPTLHEAAKHGSWGRLKSRLVLQAGFLDEDRGVEFLTRGGFAFWNLNFRRGRGFLDPLGCGGFLFRNLILAGDQNVVVRIGDRFLPGFGWSGGLWLGFGSWSGDFFRSRLRSGGSRSFAGNGFSGGGGGLRFRLGSCRRGGFGDGTDVLTRLEKEAFFFCLAQLRAELRHEQQAGKNKNENAQGRTSHAAR